MIYHHTIPVGVCCRLCRHDGTDNLGTSLQPSWLAADVHPPPADVHPPPPVCLCVCVCAVLCSELIQRKTCIVNQL